MYSFNYQKVKSVADAAAALGTNPDAKLLRFSYVRGLRAPTAVLAAAPTSGQAPLTVSFSSAG